MRKKINNEVPAARNIIVRFADPNSFSEELIRTKTNLIPDGVSEIRLAEIIGLDIQADGGTHVNNTSEVSSIKITGFENKGRSNKLIKVEIS